MQENLLTLILGILKEQGFEIEKTDTGLELSKNTPQGADIRHIISLENDDPWSLLDALKKVFEDFQPIQAMADFIHQPEIPENISLDLLMRELIDRKEMLKHIVNSLETICNYYKNRVIFEESRIDYDKILSILNEKSHEKRLFRIIFSVLKLHGFQIYPLRDRKTSQEIGIELEGLTPAKICMKHEIELWDFVDMYDSYNLYLELQLFPELFDPDITLEEYMRDPLFRDVFGYDIGYNELHNWYGHLKEMTEQLRKVFRMCKIETKKEDVYDITYKSLLEN